MSEELYKLVRSVQNTIERLKTTKDFNGLHSTHIQRNCVLVMFWKQYSLGEVCISCTPSKELEEELCKYFPLNVHLPIVLVDEVAYLQSLADRIDFIDEILNEKNI